MPLGLRQLSAKPAQLLFLVRDHLHLSVQSAQGRAQMRVLLYLPANARGRVPLFLGPNFHGNQAIHPDPAIHITPEAACGGAIAKLRDGDIIRL